MATGERALRRSPVASTSVRPPARTVSDPATRAGTRARVEGRALAVFLALPLAAHFFLSPLGFAPTDQGFILAGAERILAGEVPHRDFISVRPAGSLLLHAPAVWLGGPAALWLSRGVAWLEIAATAWIWVTLLFGRGAAPALRVAAAAAAAMLSAHAFPIMAWHTIDAAFLASAGIALASDDGARRGRRALGWLLLGLAPLCRQNFAVAPLAALVLLGGLRRPGAWALVALPGAGYAAFLAVTGGLADALLQLRTHGAEEVWRAGFLRHVTLPATWAGVGGGLACAAFAQAAAAGFGGARIAALAAAVAIVGGAAIDLAPGGRLYPWGGAFALFGAAVAVVAVRAAREGAGRAVRLGFLACVVAWAVSVSIGYNSPALAAGPLALVVLAVAPPRPAPAVLLACAIAVPFLAGRLEEIYRERPARELAFDVGRHLPAGRFLRTNPRTGLFLEELDHVAAAARSRGRQLAVVPDFAAWWVRNPERNPLPVDWSLDVELARPELVERVLRTLRERRGELVVAVQKFETHSAPGGFAPLSPTRYAVANAVRREMTKTGETLLFELYE